MSKILRIDLQLDESMSGYEARQKLCELDYRELDDVIAGEPLEFKGGTVTMVEATDER